MEVFTYRAVIIIFVRWYHDACREQHPFQPKQAGERLCSNSHSFLY
jgi:hypothetical protein